MSREGKLEYTDLGRAEFTRSSKKAMLVIVSGRQLWVPLSLLSTETGAEMTTKGETDRFRVETWFAEREELEVPGSRVPE